MFTEVQGIMGHYYGLAVSDQIFWSSLKSSFFEVANFEKRRFFRAYPGRNLLELALGS